MGRSERYLTRPRRQLVLVARPPTSNPTKQVPTVVVGSGPIDTVACMTSTAEFQEQRAACERERRSLQDRIDELEGQRAALDGQIRWLTGKIDAGHHSEPGDPGAWSKPVALTTSIIDYVRSQAEPVTALDVIEHLRSLEIPFAEKSISGLLGRHACRADEVDGDKPLRRVARGLYACNLCEAD